MSDTKEIAEDKAGIIGRSQIGRIESGLPFWDEMYMGTFKKAIELYVKPEVIRTHGISDVIIDPNDKNNKALIQWYKRHQPLTDEQMESDYGIPKPGSSASDHLKAMLESDPELYERILDTPGFAFHFNELTKLAINGEEN